MISMGYAFASKEQGVFTPDGRVDLAPSAVDTHNRTVEAAELATWRSAPDRGYGYVTLGSDVATGVGNARARAPRYGEQVKITTWLGTTIAIGRVTGISRGFHGARIVHVRVRGTNGATYTGKYGDESGQLIRLRIAPASARLRDAGTLSVERGHN